MTAYGTHLSVAKLWMVFMWLVRIGSLLGHLALQSFEHDKRPQLEVVSSNKSPMRALIRELLLSKLLHFLDLSLRVCLLLLKVGNSFLKVGAQALTKLQVLLWLKGLVNSL